MRRRGQPAAHPHLRIALRIISMAPHCNGCLGNQGASARNVLGTDVYVEIAGPPLRGERWTPPLRGDRWTPLFSQTSLDPPPWRSLDPPSFSLFTGIPWNFSSRICWRLLSLLMKYVGDVRDFFFQEPYRRGDVLLGKLFFGEGRKQGGAIAPGRHSLGGVRITSTAKVAVAPRSPLCSAFRPCKFIL